MRFIVVVVALGLLLGTSASSAAAQDVPCTPVDATEVLVLVGAQHDDAETQTAARLLPTS